jgi:putative membrane protein
MKKVSQLIAGGGLLTMMSLPVLAQGAAAPRPAPRPMVDPVVAARTRAALAANMDRLFMLKAAQGNTAEVLTGQLALRRSTNPQVRQLAQMLVREHGQANVELLQITRRKGLPLPSTVGAMHAATSDQLSRLSGARFDQMFMAAQVEAHEATILLYQQEIAQGRDRDARAYATKYLPGVLTHTAMIYNIARRVGARIADRPQALTNITRAR